MIALRRSALLRQTTLTLVLLLTLARGSSAANGVAAAAAQTMEQLEAALVITLARFVEWPPADFPSPSAPIVVAIMADEGVAAALEAAALDKKIAGRTMVVRRLQWESDVTGVHMLFIGTAEKRRLAAALDRVRSTHVVTISRLPEFGAAGGMITLAYADSRIGFSVNSRATTLSEVRLSSFVLSHATKVSDESAGDAP